MTRPKLTHERCLSAVDELLEEVDGCPRMIHLQDAELLVTVLDSLRWRLLEKMTAADAAYEFVRRTLETLTKTAGMSVRNEDGDPLRNFQLEEQLVDWIERHHD